MIPSPVKPMKAPSTTVTDEYLQAMEYPVAVSPKIDGVRAMGFPNGLRSKTLKPFPNFHIQGLFQGSHVNGLDGELVVGTPNAEDVLRQTMSGVMKYVGQPDVTYYVFDMWDVPSVAFASRHLMAQGVIKALPKNLQGRILLLPHVMVNSYLELLAYEAVQLKAGYEGIMIRHIGAPYKYGRATLKEGSILKLKRFVDSEAVVLDVSEGQINDNELVRGADGEVNRSTKKSGMRPSRMVGTLHCKDLKTGQLIDVGPGKLTHMERITMFAVRSNIVGKVITYRYFAGGVKDLPRFPLFHGFRGAADIAED
jgi:DNA ligase-1